MLFPTDPNKRPELWARFREKVAAGAVVFIVHGGRRLSGEDRQIAQIEGVDHVVDLFRNADVVTFGSAGGQAIGPFAAFELESGVAKLVEYAFDPAVGSSAIEAVQEALQSIAISFLYDRRGIKEMSVPFDLGKWGLVEWAARPVEDGTVLSRGT